MKKMFLVNKICQRDDDMEIVSLKELQKNTIYFRKKSTYIRK